MTQGWIGATDGDFLRDPAGVITRARASLGGLTGWALDAPRAVAFDRTNTVPLVLARSLSLGEDAGVNWSREATLVVSRAECGGVWVGNAFAPLDLPFTAPAAVVIPDDGARVSGCERLSLRALLPAIPWREGTLSVTALVGARRSDPVTVSLRRAAARDPQVQALLDARRVEGYPRAVSPPRSTDGGAPFYRAGQHSPRVEGGAGVALRSTVDAEGVMLWGALRGAPRGRERVRVENPSETRYARLRDAAWVDVGAPGARAVMPVTLVGRHAALPEAITVALQVPNYTEARADGTVDAFFGVRWEALAGAPEVPGRWSFWAVYGPHIAGPVEVERA